MRAAVFAHVHYRRWQPRREPYLLLDQSEMAHTWPIEIVSRSLQSRNALNDEFW